MTKLLAVLTLLLCATSVADESYVPVTLRVASRRRGDGSARCFRVGPARDPVGSSRDGAFHPHPRARLWIRACCGVRSV
ncbi:hypothetical protein E2562_007959 [Oryza meyeriana var. granulata]|uniref:Secreted protein n=1 Tax=Oryza meyeriana var. granulata TaxID=110450 RepID=A0A6G1DFI8_9ORYZ|nr:hypothetical protein E2562_007959 [Oryza meyeriana var. granulata]